MGLFETQFPYTNLHELNLDWIIDKMNQWEDIFLNRQVLSVNGQTGHVVLYQSENMVMPEVPVNEWRLVRTLNGVPYVGIRFTPYAAYFQSGNSSKKLLTIEDIPSASGVVALNGQTGIVFLYGNNTAISSDDSTTIKAYIDTLIASVNSVINEKLGDLPEGVTVQEEVETLANSQAIVAEGNTHPAIASGKYVVVLHHPTLDTGLYQARSAISANAVLNLTNLLAVADGGFNKLADDINTLNAKQIYLGTVESNSSTTFRVGTYTRIILFAIGSNNERNGIIFVYNGTSATSANIIAPSNTNLTVSVSDNNVTINNPTGGRTYIEALVLNGEIAVAQ